MTIFQEVITKFELFTDDTTELSTDEEISVGNTALIAISKEQPWEFLRTEFNGVVGSDGAVAVPADFVHFMNNWSDDNTSDIPTTKVVFVGGIRTPCFIIPRGGRNNLDRSANGVYGGRNVCWFNNTTRKIEFATGVAPVGAAVSFDYSAFITEITDVNDEIALPNGHSDLLVYSMLITDEFIQKFPSARSQVQGWATLYQQALSRLKAEDSRFIL